jgi:fimbrial isopeptide formation D2 family protein
MMERSKQWQRLVRTCLLGLLILALPLAAAVSASSPLLADPPTIEVAKRANPTQVTEPGGTVTFQVKVRNTSGGGLAVNLVRLEDDLYGDLTNPGNANVSNNTCGTTTIQAGDTYQCSFDAQVAGSGGSTVTDTITAKVKDDGGNAAQASAQATVDIIAGETPELRVEKSASPAQVTEPGGTVTFQVKVRNSAGSQALTLVRLEDDLYGDLTNTGNSQISSSTCSLGTIQPGDTYQCTFQAEVTGSGGNSVTDTVTAKARDTADNVAQASAQATVNVEAGEQAGIIVEKNASPSQVPEPGGTVTFQVKVRNESAGQTLNLVRLEDNLYGDLTNAGNSKISSSTCALVGIAPGDTYQCTFQAEVTGSSGSSVTDTVTAKANDAGGNPVQASDQATVTIGQGEQLGITVEKNANPSQVPEPGGTVTFQVKVRNESAGQTLNLDRLEDNLYGDLTNPGNSKISSSTCALVGIAPGDTYQCTFQAEVTGSSGSSVTDTVTAKAKDAGGNPVQASDQATVTIGAQPKPGITVTKKANPTWILEPGGTITYKVSVSNGSPAGLSVTMTAIQDSIYGNLTDLANPNITNSTCQLVSINAGDTYQCTFQAQVSGNAGTTVTDKVTVTAKGPAGNQVQFSDTATVKILSEPPDTGVPLTPPLIAGGLMALGAAAMMAGALVNRRAS